MPQRLPALLAFSSLTIAALCMAAAHAGDENPTQEGWTVLFSQPGVPKGWTVRAWNDVGKPAPEGAVWSVDEDGVLHGSEPRGTWLVSEDRYDDFVLEFEWKLGERGNSGCGIRFPDAGDPAFDGLEIQMVDERYNDRKDGPDRLTGSIYKAAAPRKQIYKPTEWNRYVITARGPRITVELNGEQILDINLDEQAEPIERHDGSPAPPLKDRPREGRIGFQELSRGGHVMIRNARIKPLE